MHHTSIRTRDETRRIHRGKLSAIGTVEAERYMSAKPRLKLSLYPFLWQCFGIS